MFAQISLTFVLRKAQLLCLSLLQYVSCQPLETKHAFRRDSVKGQECLGIIMKDFTIVVALKGT